MKKVIICLLLSLLLCIVVFIAYGIGYMNGQDSIKQLTMFEKEGKCITTKQLTVFQSLKNSALVDFYDDGYITALLINNENKLYYDNEKINIPKGKCAKQVGIYNYKAKSGDYNTVPVVIIK